MWTFRGQHRPDFAVEPKPGQESVWDYPRPPRCEPFEGLVTVTSPLGEVARPQGALRIMETASPPTFYLPPDDINFDLLQKCTGTSYCEWKGPAQYWGLTSGGPEIGWSYRKFSSRYHEVEGYLAFYPGRIHCEVDGEKVQPQPGGFYGGWVLSNLVGPWKGEPGTGHW